MRHETPRGMTTRSCSNCRAFSHGRCHSGPPIILSGGGTGHPEVAPTDWCLKFAPTALAQGHQTKVTDERVMNIVRQYTDPSFDPEGKPVPPMAWKRSDLVGELIDAGLTRTPALKRIDKLVRHGLLNQGDNPWPRPYPTPGIYIWPTGEIAMVKPDHPAKVQSTDRIEEFLGHIRRMAAIEDCALSLREITREIEITMDISLATASRWMNRLIAEGRAHKCEGGYYAPVAPTPQLEVE